MIICWKRPKALSTRSVSALPSVFRPGRNLALHASQPWARERDVVPFGCSKNDTHKWPQWRWHGEQRHDSVVGPDKGNGEVEKVLKETQKQAEKAKEKVEAVQQATFGGIGLVTETAHVEDDARRAAGFALGVEQQVAKQLEEAKRQAHEEAFAVMQEVMPMVKSAARSAAKKEATTGPFSKLEKSQEEQVKATAAAALNGQAAWSNAMEGATKVRDAYSRRSHELSQAAAAAEQSAQALSAEAAQWRELRSADDTKAQQVLRKAESLQERAKEAVDVAKAEDEKAEKYLHIAKSIDDSLPVYSRQAEQGAFHAIAMVAPDVPAPLPPLVLQQK